MDIQQGLEIIKTIGPTAIVAVYLTYHFGLKQKKFDQKHEHYKKLRITTANLLSIWYEFSSLERFLKSPDPSDTLIYHIPELAKRFLEIDEDKVERLKNGFHDSLENLKEIDVGLYYRLDGSLDHFNRTNEELLYPLLKDNAITQETRDEILLPLLVDLLEGLEGILLGVSEFLAKKERNEVKRILDEHKLSLATYQKPDIPLFVTNWINKSVKPVNQISSEEIINFYSDPTVNWVLSKLLSKELRRMIFGGGFIGIVKMGLNLDMQSEEHMEEIGKQLFPMTAFLEIDLTDEEDQNLINNRAFYHLLMGIVYNVTGQVPFGLKRELVRLNNGEISIKAELDQLKQQVLFEQFQQNNQTYE